MEKKLGLQPKIKKVGKPYLSLKNALSDRLVDNIMKSRGKKEKK